MQPVSPTFFCHLGVKLTLDFLAASEPEFNQAVLGQLQEMGFSENACKRALVATSNADAEEAMAWLFSHMDDAGMSIECIAAITYLQTNDLAFQISTTLSLLRRPERLPGLNHQQTKLRASRIWASPQLKHERPYGRLEVVWRGL